MNEKKMLLGKIQKYDFALKELDLYLDTHPNCKKALALFKKYEALRKEAIEEFTRRFGPLTPDRSVDDKHWSWVDDPWPWERS